MPIGTFQTNNLLHITIDTWQDQVFFNGTAYPAGTFATEVLNMDLEVMQSLVVQAGAVSHLAEQLALADREQFSVLLTQVRIEVAGVLDALWHFPPYSLMDRGTEDEVLEAIFAEEALDKLTDLTSEVRQFFFRYLTACFAIPLGIFHFGWACDYFADNYLSKLNKRNETHFAVAAHDCFNSESFWKEMATLPLPDIEAFTVTPRLASSYVFARHPKHKKEMVFVSRLRFERAMDFYVYDLLSGLHYGNAPSQCLNCGRYFLTTNGHKPKYCNGNDPQRPSFTCRQMGAKRHLKESNEDHPIYQLCRTRCGTICKHEERGKISHEVRVAAIQLATQYRDKALLDRAYAAGQYKVDMETDRLYTIVQKK